MTARIKGVLTPVVTPFHQDGSVNTRQFIAQCQWLQNNHIGLAVFGTNSEANSLSPEERIDMLDALVDAGLDTARMMPGTGACDLPTAVKLTRKAVAHGCGGVLALPPFYYKGVSDEGIFRFFAELIEQVGDAALRVYLYHIPPVAQVGFSVALVERLLKAYPNNIAGMKDSTGDIAHTQTMMQHFAAEGFDVFAGTETILLDTLRGGGAGCISATANVNAPAIYELCQSWQQDGAAAKQQALNDLRAIFQKYPMIPALKAAVAHWSGEASWRQVRAPLVSLDDAQAQSLVQELQAVGFAMEGLTRA